MAWRLRLAPEKTNINFFRWQWLTFGGAWVLMVVAILAWVFMGLNFGIDFQGGTSIRTQSAQPLDVGLYRQALIALDLGDVAVTQVFDPTFAADQYVAQVRIAAQDGVEAVPAEVLIQVEAALRAVDPGVVFTSTESVGPKVSAELIWSAILAMIAAGGGIMIYIWLRFEWQYALGAVVALFHDIIVIIGIFAVFQIKFDLTIVAALLTIIGYSVNDTVVVFDRLRENLAKYKQMPLREMMNLTANETLSRTIMTASTTVISLTVLMIFGGDVIRGFVFAMLVGVILGTYSTLYMAKNIVLMIGIDRSNKLKSTEKNEFGNVDA